MRSTPQHCTLQHKKECGIRVEPNLFRLVNVLGLGGSLVRGRVQFGSLLLKNDHINTNILVEFLGRFP